MFSCQKSVCYRHFFSQEIFMEVDFKALAEAWGLICIFEKLINYHNGSECNFLRKNVKISKSAGCPLLFLFYKNFEDLQGEYKFLWMTIDFWISSHWSHGNWCGWKSSLVGLGFSSGADPSWNIPWCFPGMSTSCGWSRRCRPAVPATHAWGIPFTTPVFYKLASLSLGLDNLKF